MKYLFGIVLLFFSSFVFGNNKTSLKKEKEEVLNIVNDWLDQTLYLSKNTVGYSPPVSARTLHYFTLFEYEILLPILENNRSLSGQLNEYKRPILTEDELNFRHLANFGSFEFIKLFYTNMSPSDLKKCEVIYNTLYNRYSKKLSTSSRLKSENYTRELLNIIYNWSEQDNASQCWNKNFPSSYSPPVCDSCWETTPPGFEKALQPFWGKNRLAVASNSTVCDSIQLFPFSEEKNSIFYSEAKMIYDKYQNLSENEITIAKYWNDAPGVSGTPAGHMFSIALAISKKEKSSLKETLEFYTLLGIAINDAVIECWRLKYYFNLIRPITYIQRYISPSFSSAINTPPFPEFPSGHSFQAGATEMIYTHFYGENYSFTDQTNVQRMDINGKERTFSSFHNMAEEMSISRFYAGIHYQKTLRTSLIFGRAIGINTIKSIEFNK